MVVFDMYTYVYVCICVYIQVKSEEELADLIDFACGVRSTAATGVHDTSSRCSLSVCDIALCIHYIS